MANTQISYNGYPTYLNDDDTTAPYLATNASMLYLNADCSNTFNNCRNMTDWNFLNKFNMDNVTNCYAMFQYCFNFNQPITIPNNVTNCSSMFAFCRNFNQPIIITIPNNVTDCSRMFFGCSNFNSNVTIGNNVTNCYQMFNSCPNFNQPITIPNGVTEISSMFSGCSNMRSIVRLPNKFNNGKTTNFWLFCPVSVDNGTLIFY